MLDNPNEPVSDLSYFDCIESVMENSKVSLSVLLTFLLIMGKKSRCALGASACGHSVWLQVLQSLTVEPFTQVLLQLDCASESLRGLVRHRLLYLIPEFLMQ